MLRRTVTTIASAGVLAVTAAAPAVACTQPTPTGSVQSQQTQQSQIKHEFFHHHHHGWWSHHAWGHDQDGDSQGSASQDS